MTKSTIYKRIRKNNYKNKKGVYVDIYEIIKYKRSILFNWKYRSFKKSIDKVKKGKLIIKTIEELQRREK